MNYKVSAVRDGDGKEISRVVCASSASDAIAVFCATHERELRSVTRCEELFGGSEQKNLEAQPTDTERRLKATQQERDAALHGQAPANDRTEALERANARYIKTIAAQKAMLCQLKARLYDAGLCKEDASCSFLS